MRLIASILLFAYMAADQSPRAVVHGKPKPLAPGAVTSDWPCLLGPRHNEVCSETHLVHQFPPAGPALIWEVKKGEGYASPAITGDKLVLFHRIGDEEVIDCLKAEDGSPIWHFAYPTAYRDEYGYCNGPRSSPVIAKDAVFAIGAEGKLHCLDLASGHVRWERDLKAQYHLKAEFFGVGSTPLVLGDLLIVNVGAPGGPCVVAFAVADGREVWRAGHQWGPSYASPVPATLHGKQRVLVFAGGRSRPPTGGLLCIDPANGKVDFAFPWRGTTYESVNAASPVVITDQVFISECYGSGGVLLDVAPDMQCKPAWTNPNFGIHFMSAVARDGLLYGVDGHGPGDAFLVCVDLKTGKERWRTQPQWDEKLARPMGPAILGTGTFRCWLMPVDGHFLCLGEYGHLLWVDLGPDGYKQICRAWLFSAAETWTPPALSRGLLYVCQNATDQLHQTGPRVLCYDLRAAN